MKNLFRLKKSGAPASHRPNASNRSAIARMSNGPGHVNPLATAAPLSPTYMGAAKV